MLTLRYDESMGQLLQESSRALLNLTSALQAVRCLRLNMVKALHIRFTRVQFNPFFGLLTKMMKISSFFCLSVNPQITDKSNRDRM